MDVSRETPNVTTKPKCYDYLIHSRLKIFVVEHILYVPEEGHAQEIFHYWVQLGILSAVAETPADLNLHWADGHLQVNEKHKSSDGLLEAGCTSRLSQNV